MSSIIASMLARLYPKPECRVLMIGLDAAGRTTALYKMKLDEVVTTIPTIGFNVETVPYKGLEFTFWDVGGCDKIRPLWRHYYQNTQAIIFFFDGNDAAHLDDAVQELQRICCEDELRDALVLIFFNKSDLPHFERGYARGMERVQQLFEDPAGPLAVTSKTWIAMRSCALTGEGLYEGLDWLKDQVDKRKVDGGGGGDVEAAKKDEDDAPEKGTDRKADKHEEMLVEWLQRVDEPDDEFLRKLRDYTLDSWDHRTHLRIAWLLLERHGRRIGMKKIFAAIQNFIANSPRTKRSRGTTFHETMTYFWVHMVHYARAGMVSPAAKAAKAAATSTAVTPAAAPPPAPPAESSGAAAGEEEEEVEGISKFKRFLLLNPILANGGLFLHFYSKKLMLNTASSRTQVVLPDLNPLPSLLTSVEEKKAGSATTTAEDFIHPSAPLSDDEWLARFEARTLGSWGHEAKLRLVWLRLSRLSRREAVKQLFDELKALEKEGHHVTRTYFWITQVTLCRAKKGASEAPTYNMFAALPHCQRLRNHLLINNYYSTKLLAGDQLDAHGLPVGGPDARTEFVPPDVKPMPSVVVG